MMIKISEDIQLKEILSTDADLLFSLMTEVYTAAYQHFWKDAGKWYIDSQYSKENLLKELSEEKAAYYFVVYKDEIIGNFRVIWDKKLAGISEEKQVKLHRIYLHQKTQGKRIGKTILSWLENNAKEKGYKIMWLDAMNKQKQAFLFYEKQGYKYHSHIFLDFELLHDDVRKMSQIYKELT